MPFQFQIQPQNSALQTIQAIDALEGNKDRRDFQKQSLQLRMQEAIEKMDVRQRERAKIGLEGMARVAGAARNGVEWDTGIRALVSQGYKEFEGEIGKWSPAHAAFNLRKEQDVKTLFENSPEQRAAKVQFEADKYNATIPGRMQVAQAGKTTVNVGAPSMPVPKIDPATGKFLGFEAAPAAPQAGAGRPGAAKQDASGLGTPTINALEETSLKAGENIARLDEIIGQFKPEYQTLGTRWKNMAVAFGEKAGRDPSPSERAELEDFTKYRRNVTDNLNKGINEATGAAMGVEEAKRLSMAMPVAGQGLLDGDSPTEFLAKAVENARMLRNAQMRANWARRHGLDPLKTGVELHAVPGLVNDRGQAIEALMRKERPNWGDEEIKQAVRRQLGQEFGMNR